MNKEEILDYVKERNGKLIGYFKVPFPVYVVHVAYDSVDSNPLFPLDRAILQYVKLCPKMDKTTYFSNLIGFETQLIKKRISVLREEALIILDEGTYSITDHAERKYLMPNNRPTVRITGSFIVDGKTLDLLPPFVYTSARSLSYRDLTTSAHLPVDLEMNRAPAESIKAHLKTMSVLEMLNLESSGNNFEVQELDKRFLNGAYAVIYSNHDNRIRKEIVYNGEKLECAATGEATTYTIELRQTDKQSNTWSFEPNLGYNVSDMEKISNRAVNAPLENLACILDDRYKTKEYPYQARMDEVTGIPCVCLNEKLLQCADAPMEIVEDAARGYIDLPTGSSGVVRLPVDNKIENFIEFVNIIKESTNSAHASLAMQQLSTCLSNWRYWMVKFKMYDELEKIDCDCFILNR